MEEKKGNSTNKLLIVLVVLLSLLVGGFGGYIVFSNISDSKNFNKIEGEAIDKDNTNGNNSGNTQIEDNNKVESISILSETVQNAMDKISGITCTKGNYKYCYYYTEELKSDYYALLYRQDKLLAKDLNNELKLLLAYEIIDVEKEAQREQNYPYFSISEDEFISFYHKVFGSSATYQWSENYSGDNSDLKFGYRENGRIYFGTGGRGDTRGPGHVILNKLSRAEKTANELYIYEIMAVVNETSNDIKLYSDLAEKDLIDTINLDNSSYADDKVFDSQYIDKLPEYKFTFKLENDNYYFYSVEKVK